MKQTRADPPTVLVAIDLAYQNGRDYYAGILRHLETARRRWNIHLVRHGLTCDILTRELTSGIDGLMFDYTASDDVIPLLVDQTIPGVALDCARPDLFGARRRNLSFVDIDSDAIGRRAAEYLSAQGRYAMFGAIGYEAACNWSERRIRSFEERIAAGTGETKTLRIRRADIGNPGTREAVREWIANLPRPTAVMAVCDELARLLVDVITAAGVRVPQEIAVLGVDNEWILCTHMRPTLSSIHPDFEHSGFLAAQCMERMLRRAAPILHEIAPVKDIVERESTAPSSPAGQMVARAEETCTSKTSCATSRCHGGCSSSASARSRGIPSSTPSARRSWNGCALSCEPQPSPSRESAACADSAPRTTSRGSSSRPSARR